MIKIDISEHQTRRANLLSLMDHNSVCVVGSASAQTRSNDTDYSFRQDSYFWYLTGFDEPDATLILIKYADGQTHVFMSLLQSLIAQKSCRFFDRLYFYRHLQKSNLSKNIK